MDVSKYLILVDGKDVTKNVEEFSKIPQTEQYEIAYIDGKKQPFESAKVAVFENPACLDPKQFRITTQYKTLDNIHQLMVFKDESSCREFWCVVFKNGSSRSYPMQKIKVEKSCMEEPTINHRLKYLHKLAELNKLKTEDGTLLLEKYYQKLEFVHQDSALAAYLDPERHRARKFHSEFLIFPFGGNASQFAAVENAFTNQISVIQGPPGTGKTQTILNIIANLLIRNKTAQVVSSNNSAIINVREKLASPKYNLSFIVALLGNSDNKTNFLKNQTNSYPDLSMYAKSGAEQYKMRERISLLFHEMGEYFSKQTRLATVKQAQAALELEMQHFAQYTENSAETELCRKIRRAESSDKVMQLLQEYEAEMERRGHITVWLKIKNTFSRGILDWRFYKQKHSSIMTGLQQIYYRTKHTEVAEELKRIEEFLAGVNAERKLQELETLSMDYLRAVLYDRYKGKTARIIFDENTCNSKSVLEEYPIILSSTFSSSSTLKNVTYDYVIMDEASQVDIATGSLALSCAKNAVIVGDLKQLSNIVKRHERRQYDAIFKEYGMPEGYSNSECSFLKSVCTVLPDAPQILLREHYRCHPKIIEFCNQKFYDNELFIMTQDCGETDAVTLVRTVVGDHQRGKENQRQADVIEREILPKLTGIEPEHIGIITPYRDQVKKVIDTISKKIDVDTIHKFQGMEKDIIILSMVDDVIQQFSDSPDLLNVAISRAKKNLYIVMSGNEQPADSNIQDFMDYIEYNNLAVVKSGLRSIFDLLYRQYTEQRLEYLAKHKRISQYDSENLMYAALTDVLRAFSKASLRIICHPKLLLLIRDFSRLTKEEYLYATNPNTHVDFLIYNHVSKKPILAIEVDGFNFHKEGTRQAERDRLKDSILRKYMLPLVRVATNGCEEVEVIKNYLNKICKL